MMLKKLLVALTLLGATNPVFANTGKISPEQTKMVLSQGKIISSSIITTMDYYEKQKPYMNLITALGSFRWHESFIFWDGNLYLCQLYGLALDEGASTEANCYGYMMSD